MVHLTIKEALKLGVKAHKSQNYPKAELYYSGILKAYPSHPDANHNMGVLAVEIGKTEQSIDFFETAIKSNSKIIQYWVNLIGAYIKINKFPEAEQAIQRAIDAGVNPEELKDLENKCYNTENKPSLALLNHIQELYQAQKFQEVINEIKSLLKDFPNSSFLLGTLGGAYNALRQFDTAARLFKSAINIDPNRPELHNNLGTALKGLGSLDEAIFSYKRAIEINMNFPEAYNNLGLCFKEKGQVSDAIISCKKAIKLNENMAESYITLGAIYQNQEKFKKAIKLYKTAISLKPNIKELHYNLAKLSAQMGDFESSLNYHKSAICIDPNYKQAWYNAYYVAKAAKKRRLFSIKDKKKINKSHNCKFFNLENNILEYQLNSLNLSENKYLSNIFDDLSNLADSSIQNPKATKRSSSNNKTEFTNIFSLIHFGRSGTGLLHSLVDSHPEVITLPSIFLSEFFNPHSWDDLISSGWDSIVGKFIKKYEILFDATSSQLVETASYKPIQYLGFKEGLTNLGPNKNEILVVNKEIFRLELTTLIESYSDLNIFTFFTLVHLAYEKSLNRQNESKVLFYHIHNPGYPALFNYLHAAPFSKNIIMIREPLQSCESWIKKSFEENDHGTMVVRIAKMLSDISNPLYSNNNCVAVRLEDLKKSSEKTIRELCSWMKIKHYDGLYEMTMLGKKWWGDPASPDYNEDGMKPFGETSINRELGAVFSKNDQYILRTLFYPFSVKHGYAKEDRRKFKVDLAKIKCELLNPFDFEKTIIARSSFEEKDFRKNSSFIFFHNFISECWDVLNTHGSYPNMIPPLASVIKKSTL